MTSGIPRRLGASANRTAAAWGVLRCAAVEYAGQTWHGLDCSTSMHPSSVLKVRSQTPRHIDQPKSCTASGLCQGQPWTSFICLYSLCMWHLHRSDRAPPAQHVCAESSEAAGTVVDGSAKHSARLLRSPIRHLSGPYQLTPRPRGSFSTLIRRTLPKLLLGPDEVGHTEISLCS